MKVYTKCPDCQTEISIRTLASTRVELAMDKGEEVKVTCKGCNTGSAIHVNDFEARHSKTAQIVSLLVLVVGIVASLVFSWRLPDILSGTSAYLIALPIGLPMFVFLAMRKQDQNRVSIFNNTSMRR